MFNKQLYIVLSNSGGSRAAKGKDPEVGPRERSSTRGIGACERTDSDAIKEHLEALRQEHWTGQCGENEGEMER